MQAPIKKIQPLLGRVLIQKYIPPKKTSSGVLLPDSKNVSNIGKVVDLGPGRLANNGKHIPSNLKVGQFVLLPEYGSTKLPKISDQDELYIYQQEDIIAVIEGEFNTKI